MGCFFLLLWTSFSWALSPEELRESVLKNFPLIEEAQFKQKASNEEVRASKGEFDHKLKIKAYNRFEDVYDNQYYETLVERNTGVQGISLLAGHRQGTGSFPVYDGKYLTSPLGQIFAGITLPILRNRSTDEARTNLSLARLNRDQAQEEVRIKQFIYVHKALSLYYKWISEDRILNINTELLTLANQREDMLQRKFKLGDIEKVKLTDNERTIAKREAEIQKSEAKLRTIEAELLLFTGDLNKITSLKNSSLKPLSDPRLGPLPDPNTLPQIKILELEKQKGDLLAKLYDQERLPGLGLDVLGVRELESGTPHDRERLQVGVRFDFPLENRKAEGKSVAQVYKLKALDKRILYTSRELQINFSNALNLIGINLKRFNATSQEAERSRIMAKAEQTRFRMGSSELFTVLLREFDVSDAEIRKWMSWYDFNQAVLDAKLFQGTI